MEIAGVEIKETDRLYLTGEQIEEINQCLNYLNGYIEGILLIGKGCFLTGNDSKKQHMGVDEIGMALWGLSEEASNKWCSMRDIITDEVHEQIKKQKEEVSHE